MSVLGIIHIDHLVRSLIFFYILTFFLVKSGTVVHCQKCHGFFNKPAWHANFPMITWVDQNNIQKSYRLIKWSVDKINQEMKWSHYWRLAARTTGWSCGECRGSSRGRREEGTNSKSRKTNSPYTAQVKAFFENFLEVRLKNHSFLLKICLD